MYKVLIFDFDGTLCNTLPATQYAMREAFLEALNVAPSIQSIANIVSLGLPLEKSISTLYCDITGEETDKTEELVTLYREHYKSNGEQQCLLYQGCEEFLNFATSRDIQIVILSNKGQAAVERAVKQLSIAQHIQLIIADVANLPKKPAPEAFTKRIQPHFSDMKLNDFLMIGDTDADIVFAHNAGIDSCWAAYGYGNKESCEAARPTYRIETLNALTSLVKD